MCEFNNSFETRDMIESQLQPQMKSIFTPRVLVLCQHLAADKQGVFGGFKAASFLRWFDAASQFQIEPRGKSFACEINSWVIENFTIPKDFWQIALCCSFRTAPLKLSFVPRRLVIFNSKNRQDLP